MEREPEKQSQQLYVGKLPRKLRQEELEKEFEKFGKITQILLKSGFAFLV
jgi:RNA recognition motif-containing protein